MTAKPGERSNAPDAVAENPGAHRLAVPLDAIPAAGSTKLRRLSSTNPAIEAPTWKLETRAL
jgi:hypothetical protein